jgi:hypothetical protein
MALSLPFNRHLPTSAWWSMGLHELGLDPADVLPPMKPL